jgi:hypothetical protein
VQHSRKKFDFLLKNPLPRVPLPKHSGKKLDYFYCKKLFPECLGRGNRGSHFFCFFAFPCEQQIIYISQTTNQHQYITNHIYKSQTTKYVRNPQYIRNHSFKSTHYSMFTSAIHKYDFAGGSWKLGGLGCPNVGSRRCSRWRWPDMRRRQPSDMV